MKTRPDLAALSVVALIIVGVVACALARVPTPTLLPELGLLLCGGGLGVALNTGARATAPLELDTTAPPPAATAASYAAPVPVSYAAALTPPAPRGSTVYNPDDTSTFPRIATHD